MNKMKLNKKKVLTGSGIFILAILILLITINKTTNQQNSSINQTEKTTIDNSKKTTSNGVIDTTNDNNENVIDENTKSEIDRLISKYYDISNTDSQQETKIEKDKELKQKRSHIEVRNGIEKYENIKTYVRLGLKENTYIVFTTYDMKFINIDTLAPGMSVLSITKDENGDFFIQDKEADEKINAYINELIKEDEINNLIQNVNNRLKKIVKKDESLKEFIEKLEDISQ